MKKVVIIVLISTFIIGCQQEEIPVNGFLRIYDHSNLDIEFTPVSMAETSTGGLMILSEQTVENSEFSTGNIIVTDDEGSILSQATLTDGLGVPIGDLMKFADAYYFFTLDINTYECLLISVDENGAVASPISIPSLSFPLAASKVGDQMLLLSYDAQNQNSILSLINLDGSLANLAAYSIGAGTDAQQRILDHYFEKDKRLPFFTGQHSSGAYYFNGIYNYTLSLVFSDMSANPQGIIQGQAFSGGVSAIEPGGSALVGFQYQDIFWELQPAINTSSVTSSISYFNNRQHEIKSKSPSKILNYTNAGTSYILIAAETEKRQAVLYFIDASSGIVEHVEYIGYANPFTFSDLIVSENNDLFVTGSTFVNSQFERAFVKKFTSDEINEKLSLL
ncbi:MAG: hypothetical protein JXQ90_21335 [Cyclobacteriaceae bacterium]